MSTQFSARAEIISRRTYHRPLNPEGTKLETWDDVVNRTDNHQAWLWQRQVGDKPLGPVEFAELDELRKLQFTRKALLAGRTLWMGGTEVAKTREASQFNCAFTKIETVHDAVDMFWLLLQGCGVGFMPITGTLNGFLHHIPEIEVRPSTRADKGACTNTEYFDAEINTWRISVGDSAEAWAKALGKLLAGKYNAKKLILSFQQIRPPGTRLSGYGWISAGDNDIRPAFAAIVNILNKRAGQHLTILDILDICNLAGSTLTSRRAAEMAVCIHGTDGWYQFAEAKTPETLHKYPHRSQSNNSLIFYSQPSQDELKKFLLALQANGGSEPGIINGMAARCRAPWFSGVNPCAEILLPNKGFCNLVEINVAAFDSFQELERAVYIMARANYRQTLVNLEDGILQRAWHENNEFLRLCGVSLTGLVRANYTAYQYKCLRNAAITGAYAMAAELGTQRPKNITTIKPGGTTSKIMDTTECAHRPVGKFIFNNVAFSVSDPLIPKLREANYYLFDHPNNSSEIIARLPVSWLDVEFNPDGINTESAIDQLNRYKLLMDNYVDQNCSISVYYSSDEIDKISEWLFTNWDSFVGVAFMPRLDHNSTANDLGYPYLPQEVVDKVAYDNYTDSLKPIDYTDTDTLDEIVVDDCAAGACPVK